MAQRAQTLAKAQLTNKKPSVTIERCSDDCKDLESINSTIKVDSLTVNIRSSFNPEKKLYDALYSIANARLKEKSE